jgi:hypothetical protein
MTFAASFANTLHLNLAHFNQGPQLARTDRQQICPPGFDIAQRPAKMDCFLET